MRADDDTLARETAAVREASRAGEIVAVTPDDGRSLANHVGRATVRVSLLFLLMFAAVIALSLLF